MQFDYKLKLHNLDKVLPIRINFDPYTNLLSGWNEVVSGWSSPNSSASVIQDTTKLLGTKTIQFLLAPNAQEGSMRKTIQVDPNKNYMVSCYVRNNGIMTTALRVGGTSDESSNYFANRLIVVANSGDSGLVEVNLDFYYPSDYTPNTWVGGFFMAELTEQDLGLSSEDLSKKYTYITGTKASPSMRDVLVKKYDGSPYQYYLTMDGIRVKSYDLPLVNLGVTSETILETHTNELPVQLYYTLTNSVALMAMLEGDPLRVSHTYPKMQEGMVDLKIFPRVQYFMGFEVSSYRADSKSFANNVNVTINAYVPITRVTNSMQDSMISTIITSLMSDLGFSAIRGSDFFREPEQLYVRQTQYVKDVQIIKKVKT